MYASERDVDHDDDDDDGDDDYEIITIRLQIGRTIHYDTRE